NVVLPWIDAGRASNSGKAEAVKRVALFTPRLEVREHVGLAPSEEGTHQLTVKPVIPLAFGQMLPILAFVGAHTGISRKEGAQREVLIHPSPLGLKLEDLGAELGFS